jgi:DNA-binding MarR family transcriptional regulator
MSELLRERLEQTRSFENEAQAAMLNLMLAAVTVGEWNERACAAYGITRSQYNVLRILRGVYPNGHPRQEITRRMVDRSPDVTRLIDRLEAAGLVERERTQEDRRLSIARITQKGLDLIDRMNPEFVAIYETIARRLAPDELEALSRLCERLYAPEKAAR